MPEMHSVCSSRYSINEINVLHVGGRIVYCNDIGKEGRKWGKKALHWRHKEHPGAASNHRRPVCLFCRLFRHQRNHQGPRYWSFMRGIYRWPVVPLTKGPQRRNRFHLTTSSWMATSAWIIAMQLATLELSRKTINILWSRDATWRHKILA